MRCKERIRPFLRKIDIENAFTKWNIPFDQNTIDDVNSNMAMIRDEWEQHPDWRFQQVLINLGIIQNFPGMWYYMEEEELLLSQGYSPAEVYFWGTNFTKDMVPLKETKWRAIENLETDHLRAIIDGGWVSHNKVYKDAMLEELRYREEAGLNDEDYFDDDNNDYIKDDNSDEF
jgi:hypothetical protein